LSVFVDTSALLAVLRADDPWHAAAAEVWSRFALERPAVVTTSYVLLETSALLQRRFGIAIVAQLYSDILPAMQVYWVGEELHRAAVAILIGANRRDLSLVDCVSFQAMRDLHIRRAFAFDPHFAEQGFGVLPAD
jgi:predicted nucleic acid-binding protein